MIIDDYICTGIHLMIIVLSYDFDIKFHGYLHAFFCFSFHFLMAADIFTFHEVAMTLGVDYLIITFMIPRYKYRHDIGNTSLSPYHDYHDAGWQPSPHMIKLQRSSIWIFMARRDYAADALLCTIRRDID